MDTSKTQLYVYIDFEYSRSSEEHPNLVSCSLSYSSMVYEGETLEYWLHKDPMAKSVLVDTLNHLKKDGAIFVAYASNAEARCFSALGLDPRGFKWIDLYSEWLQLTFNNNDCAYGTYYTGGFERYSVPPKYDASRNIGKDNTKVGRGLTDCIAQVTGIQIDTTHKKAMRDLIISDPVEYTFKEKKDIIAYCTSDIKHLPSLLEVLTYKLQRAIKLPAPQVLNAQLMRGDFMASLSLMEDAGYPVKVEEIQALRHNFTGAQDTILTDLVTNHYPFYIREKKRVSDIRGTWVNKASKMVEYIESKGLATEWPTTEKGAYSTEDEVLEKYQWLPEIKAYREARKLITQLSWFKAPDQDKLKKNGDFFDSIGSDNRLRTFLGAYGTQTSRNAPKASRFILAMSSWLRCTIAPPTGKVIIGADFGSQEFFIAGWLSKDIAMIDAYNSGDPYLYLAKMAGSVPKEAEPKLCKTPELLLKDVEGFIDPFHPTEDELGAVDPAVLTLYQEHLQYQESRNLFKSLTLGLQFGLGYKNLAIKLTADMGRKVSEVESKKLVNLHKRTYKTFWRWTDKVARKHASRGCYTLWDGWSLLKDIDNTLSIKNFPVQGTGAVCMRQAVKLIHDKGIKILSPLHDAIYAECDEQDAKQVADTIAQCMQDATRLVIDNDPTMDIRIDVDIHGSTDTWIEPKGRKYYSLLRKYLEPIESLQDRDASILAFLGN